MRWIVLAIFVVSHGCGDSGGGGGAGEAPPEADRVDAQEAARIDTAQAAAEQRASSGETFTRVFKHPVGVYFYYPDGWKVEQVSEMLRLVPSDAGKEEILIYGEHAGGQTDPAAPQVVQYLEQGITQLFPVLKRDGPVATRDVGPRKAAVFDWKGTQEKTPYRGRTWIGIVEGYAVALLVATPETSFEKRARTGEELFATFAFKKPASDPRLVGKWLYEKTYMSGGFSAVTVRYLFLHADGTCKEGGRMMASMQHTDSAGDHTGDTSADSGGSGMSHGRWSTSGKTLRLDWGGSTEEWQFIISGDDLLFKSGKTRKLWKRRG
jgi:hypothetical protein